MKWWFGSALWMRILFGMALGVAVGFVLRPGGLAMAAGVDVQAVDAGLKLIGDAFIRLIRMLAVPLIFVSVTAAVVSIADLSKLGKSGARVAALYIPSGLMAATLGLGLALWLKPGVGSAPPAGIIPPEPRAPPTAQELLFQFIPANPVQALANGDMLSVIVFAILFGVGILGAGAAAKPVADAIDGASHVFIKLVGYVMELAPLGAFALMAWVVAVAYSTSSSAATLPVTMRAMVDKLGISRRMSAFVASLGATVNMDGSAMYMVILTVFGAQLFGVELTTPQMISIVVTSSIGAMGLAGIPGGSLVFIPAVLGIAGVPLEVIGIVLGVDRLMDMMRTVVNVVGDAVAAVAVAKWEGELDEDAYLANRAPVISEDAT